MRNGRAKLYGVAAEIDRRRKDMTEEHIRKVPLQVREPGVTVFDEMVGSRIRHLCAFREVLRKECDDLATEKGKESPDWQMENALCKAVDQVIEIEVWDQYSKLIGKAYVIYDGWAIGYEKFEAETGDLFTQPERAVLAPKVRRNGDDIKLTAGALH